MGKPLTEKQKAERAVKKQQQRIRDELGPLFAAEAEREAEAIDVHDTMMRRRLVWAKQKADVNELLGAQHVLTAIEESALRTLASKSLSPEWMEALTEYRVRVVSPSPGYGVAFWGKVLRGEKVVLSWDRHEDPSHRPQVWLTEKVVFPPPGWSPPTELAERDKTRWRECKQCALWHAPGQVQCLPVLVDPQPLAPLGNGGLA